MQLTHLSLFSGIGGLDLSAEWAGFKTVGQCEFADYPTKILEKHWPNIPRWRDIRDVTAESFRERTGISSPTIISGGYPCQPFSEAAGNKTKGFEDSRYLWPEMFRIIQELRPNWVIGENVANHIRLGLDKTLSDLESEGYNTRAFNIPACSLGAWHERQRVFIVAHTNSIGNNSQKKLRANGDWAKEVQEWINSQLEFTNENINGKWWWGTEPNVGRVVHGFSVELDRIRKLRLKCLGNAVSPYQAYPILRAIIKLETYILSIK